MTKEKTNIRVRQLPADRGQFIFQDDGFHYSFKERDGNLMYTAIERIAAYKLDLMTTDEICMDILSADGQITFSESMKGWCQLLAELKIAFPSISDDWDVQIVRPPFATNYAVLYERGDWTETQIK